MVRVGWIIRMNVIAVQTRANENDPERRHGPGGKINETLVSHDDAHGAEEHWEGRLGDPGYEGACDHGAEDDEGPRSRKGQGGAQCAAGEGIVGRRARHRRANHSISIGMEEAEEHRHRQHADDAAPGPNTGYPGERDQA